TTDGRHRAVNVAPDEFLNDVEGGRCDPTRMPLLRAVLGRFDDDDAVLALVTHHTVSDAWSMHLIMRDVAVCYARRRGLPAPELPEIRQYGEYASCCGRRRRQVRGQRVRVLEGQAGGWEVRHPSYRPTQETGGPADLFGVPLLVRSAS
ncbi:condensation domain-containing protein, partial [Salinispora arenicola]|uniref:condensation domain-containing protein n=1 Tax=Salinispora arenicola TaxID=168697 RepID=UPI0027DD0876